MHAFDMVYVLYNIVCEDYPLIDLCPIHFSPTETWFAGVHTSSWMHQLGCEENGVVLSDEYIFYEIINQIHRLRNDILRLYFVYERQPLPAIQEMLRQISIIFFECCSVLTEKTSN